MDETAKEKVSFKLPWISIIDLSVSIYKWLQWPSKGYHEEKKNEI